MEVILTNIKWGYNQKHNHVCRNLLIDLDFVVSLTLIMMIMG